MLSGSVPVAVFEGRGNKTAINEARRRLVFACDAALCQTM